MKYIINIDKSSYGNPSEDLRQYEIDIDVLRRKGNVYDSLIIDDTARVIRRIEHKNGEDYILENPIIENLSMIKIELFQGVNYIYVTMDGEILSTSTIVIDYLLKNDFTETYPTVIEMHSAIEQSASNIILQVERKADADKIISLINLSPEEITIDSNRISLQGKEINLTSDNVIITSNNFSVDEKGNITCSSATITGGSLKIGSKFSVDTSGNMTCSNATITGGTISGTTLDLISNFSPDGIVLPSITIVQPTGSSGITEIGGNYINFSNDEIINGVKSYNTTINSKGITVAYSLDGTRITSSVINHDLIKYGNQLKSPNSSGIYLDQYGNIHTQQTITSGYWAIQNGDNVPLKVNWGDNTVQVYNSLKIPKNGSEGYGLCNADGTSIIRDHNNKNVTVDATGGTLYLGYQNTIGINFLNDKVSISSNGTITTPYITVNSSETLNGNLYMDSGAIRSKKTYDSDTVTNSPNMYVTSNGWFRRTTNTSSYKVKKDIKRYKKENDINEELNPEKLYDVKVWQFKYRDEYFKSKNDKRYNKDLIGFILEDMARKYPIAVDYDEDENGIPRPESWNSQYLIPAMLYLIQEQHKEIEELKSLMKGE